MKSTLTTNCLVLALALGASLAVTMALAQEGPNLRTMQCAEARAMVSSQGAAVLNSGPNIFNRYVKDAAYCASDQHLQPAWVRTTNSPSCFVGYTCTDQRGDF